MNKNNGQNLVEFAILLSILVIASIAVYSTLGSHVNNLFTNSNTQFKGYKPFSWDNNQIASAVNSTPNPITPANSNNPPNPETVVSPAPIEFGSSTKISNVNGIDVFQNTDGSIEFNVDGQSVKLSKEILDLQNTVFEGVGTSGTEKLVEMMAYMISQHKDEYPGDVPIEASYGTSGREYKDPTAPSGVPPMTTIEGKAEVNMLSLKVGNHVLIYENDQINSSGDGTVGTFNIEGYINNGVFNASISSGDNQSLNGQSIAMNVDDSTGLVLNGDMSGISATSGTYTADYNVNWNLNFPDDPDKQFQVGN